jgi:hypothetical protein
MNLSIFIKSRNIHADVWVEEYKHSGGSGHDNTAEANLACHRSGIGKLNHPYLDHHAPRTSRLTQVSLVSLPPSHSVTFYPSNILPRRFNPLRKYHQHHD